MATIYGVDPSAVSTSVTYKATGSIEMTPKDGEDIETVLGTFLIFLQSSKYKKYFILIEMTSNKHYQLLLEYQLPILSYPMTKVLVISTMNSLQQIRTLLIVYKTK